MDRLFPRLQKGKRNCSVGSLRQSSTGVAPGVATTDLSFCGKSHPLFKKGDSGLLWWSQNTLGSLISMQCCSWQDVCGFDFPAMTLALQEFRRGTGFLTSILPLVVFKISCCVFFSLAACNLNFPLAFVMSISLINTLLWYTIILPMAQTVGSSHLTILSLFLLNSERWIPFVSQLCGVRLPPYELWELKRLYFQFSDIFHWKTSNKNRVMLQCSAFGMDLPWSPEWAAVSKNSNFYPQMEILYINTGKMLIEAIRYWTFHVLGEGNVNLCIFFTMFPTSNIASTLQWSPDEKKKKKEKR